MRYVTELLYVILLVSARKGAYGKEGDSELVHLWVGLYAAELTYYSHTLVSVPFVDLPCRSHIESNIYIDAMIHTL